MLDLIHWAIDFFLHLDKHLGEILQTYGAWTYSILFVIVFCETGFVVTPFLPGDSLLFAAGTFAGLGALNVHVVFVLLTIAAILGDTINYWIGHWVGPKVFTDKVRWLRRDYLDRTHQFYERHGGKTIILARFVPIIRTFAPFVAGVGAMTYRRFIAYNVVGGTVWVAIFVYGGYFFGNLQMVKKHFSLVILGIIVVSVLPIAWEWLRMSLQKNSNHTRNHTRG